MARQHRVVAELGRPETPEEAAQRKAQASRDRRARQTVNNLWYSLLATLGIVLVVVLLVPRSQAPIRGDVDYRKVAAQASASLSEPVLVPTVPTGWSSNAAELRTETADDVTEWYIGFLTPGNEFIGFSEGFDANATWLLGKVEGARETGSQEIGGLRWSVFDNRTAEDPGLAEYALATTVEGTAFVLYGSANDEEFRTLAEGVAAEITTAESTTPQTDTPGTTAPETSTEGNDD
jgi:hypothetical protein